MGRILTQNWPYKVAAIVLSVLLWVSVSAGGERSEQSIPTRLEIQVRDSAWSLREVIPADIMTTFRGSRAVFASLFEQPMISKIINQVDSTVMQIPLSRNEVIYDPSLGVEPMSVDPSSVTVYLENRVGKWVRVRGRTDATPEDDAVVLDMDVAPDSVWLHGPASFVSSISEVTTELLSIGEVSQSVTRQLAIALPPDLTGLEVTPATVLGSVEVDSISRRRFQRSVEILGSFAEGLELDPATVTVEVSGAASTVDALQASDLRVFVEPTAVVSEPVSQRVRVELPPDVTATLDFSPERVTASPASSTSPSDSFPR